MSAGGGHAPVRVLVVDDDATVALVHRGYVETLPRFTVCGVVHRGADVLPAVRATAADLVLLDIHLPDESGLDVLRRLRAHGVDVDVVAITAARDVDTVRDAMAGGVWHYLVKPFSLATFAERMEAYAQHRLEFARRDGSDALGQEEVDRLLTSRRRSASALPKGLSPRTLDVVVDHLRAGAGGDGTGDVSAAELAARCGIARVSVRRYLEHLERAGLAEVRPRYGRAGRPENGYRWSG
ncbi:response regulator [Kineococcus radiotolerans]|uniref:Transcriptional regulatory protein n=1 Tax=Kineococcus radiotolerans (strain ATCC BAA-149 / DSM 14245 / SRS30216) TaxID=266940 RepID=A6W416_KINRD|nr:response regulator [Kineococcus radiotolerans]ABS01555.1 response regulator receiver and unknown domain protein [Kineococcus radiotolerans SRS30216 = ATCC BAA-149]